MPPPPIFLYLNHHDLAVSAALGSVAGATCEIGAHLNPWITSPLTKDLTRANIIDMYRYRRRGHNEQDDPTFTQPMLCRRIAQRASVREGYVARGVVWRRP